MKKHILDYAARQYGTVPEYPWFDENIVLRHSENAKWYAAILTVRRDRVGLGGEGDIALLNVKCDPLLVGSLLAREGFLPAYHMNKQKWISARLDGSVSARELEQLIDLSYALTGVKLRTKRTKEAAL